MSQFRKPGDWDCPKCNDHQFARNTHCRKCGAGKPNSEYHDLEAAPAPQNQNQNYQPRFREFKRGDWSCPACGDHQFASRTECRRCGSPKNAGELSQDELKQIWEDFLNARPKKYCDNCRASLEAPSPATATNSNPTEPANPTPAEAVAQSSTTD